MTGLCDTWDDFSGAIPLDILGDMGEKVFFGLG
jgi:hypothetical protein